MPRARRREREIQQTRELILEAAERVFAEKGYSEATIQEIADAADYSVPTLYAYFKGKQAIVDALFENCIAMTAELYRLVMPEGLTLRQRLEMLLRHQFAWLEKKRPLFQVLMRHGRPPAERPDANPESVEGRVTLMSEMVGWFEANVRPEELNGRDPRLAGTVFWSLCHTFLTLWLADPTGPSLQARVHEVIDLTLYGVLGAGAGAG